MYVGQARHPGLPLLARRQHGVVTRGQLRRLGATQRQIDTQVRAGRWTAITSHVVLLHNHEPTREQWMWIAIADASPFGALASHTALERAGFRGFALESAAIHLVVPRGSKTTPFQPVRVHESRRFTIEHIHAYADMPCTEVHRSAVDAAAWQRRPRFAATMMAAVVQQGVCSVPLLRQALDEVGRVRHRTVMRLALQDIEGGAQALSEIDIARMCRRFGLQPPHRQRVRRDRSGRKRYLDCEWDLPDGSVVILEVDGAHHMDAVHWDADIKRQRKVVTRQRHLVRCTAMEARLEQQDLAADLAAMGVPTL